MLHPQGNWGDDWNVLWALNSLDSQKVVRTTCLEGAGFLSFPQLAEDQHVRRWNFGLLNVLWSSGSTVSNIVSDQTSHRDFHLSLFCISPYLSVSIGPDTHYIFSWYDWNWWSARGSPSLNMCSCLSSLDLALQRKCETKRGNFILRKMRREKPRREQHLQEIQYIQHMQNVYWEYHML